MSELGNGQRRWTQELSHVSGTFPIIGDVILSVEQCNEIKKSSPLVGSQVRMALSFPRRAPKKQEILPSAL